MTRDLSHLGPDELDLWLDGRLPDSRTSHLETCDTCRTAAEETRELVDRLNRLPRVEPQRRFADLIMARVALAGNEHLTDADLDLWVEGALPAARESHLRACPECQKVADAERVLVLRLQAMPLFNPAPGFSARVMDRVNLPITSVAGAWRLWRTRVFANPIGLAAAAGVGVMLGGSLAASAAWAAAHQDTITGVGTWAMSQGQQLFWQGVSAVTATLQAQPWYASLRASLTPVRIGVVATAGVALYAAGLVALRRLLALPSSQVARAVS